MVFWIANFDYEKIINPRPEWNARENQSSDSSNQRAQTASGILKFADLMEPVSPEAEN